MTEQNPTGVFVQLPVNLGMHEAIDAYQGGVTDTGDFLLTIGTPVTGEGLEALGIARMIENNGIGWQFIPDDERQHYVGKRQRVEVVTPLDAAQAKLAERDAKIAKLREYYEANEAFEATPYWALNDSIRNRLKTARKALKGPEA